MNKQAGKTMTIILGFVVFMCAISCSCHAQNGGIPASDLFGRKYKAGEVYRYKLTMDEFHDGKWDHTNIAVCELKVIKDSSGVLYDEVRWVSKKTLSTKDTVDGTADALSVKPYRISLDPKGRIDLPKIEVPSLTEPIQDFNTFFVAVSPLVGATRLNKKGDSIINKEPVKADFSNGANILKGEDCIGFYVKIADITKKNVMLYTSFYPPSQPCLSFLSPDMNTPVVTDTINNFQMVMQLSPDKYLVQYGRESFYINSTMQRPDGKLISATMFNKLNLKLKINCDKDYKGCQFEMPFAEERKLTLTAL